MKSKKNNLFLYVLVTLFICALSIGQVKASEYVNYYGIAMSDEEYNNLLELGFSEDEIYYMNEETFETNKNIESSLEVKDERYYKTVYTDLNGETYSTEITKDEYNNQSGMNTRGTVETTYKTMVTTMSKNSNNTFRYKVSVAWKLFPSTRSYDIIGIGFADDVYISSGIYFSYHYCNASAECTESSLYYDKKQLSTGGSIVYKLPSGDIRELSTVLYYDVSKNTSSTITRLDMCGDYSHATTAISSNYDDYTVNINGLQLHSSIAGYYDAIPCALSSWGGSW